MNKEDAIKQFVKELNTVPQSWVQAALKQENSYVKLPMWGYGYMWILDELDGRKLWQKHSRVMVGDASEIDLDAITDIEEKRAVKKAIKELEAEEIDWAGCLILENYVDESMAGERCVLDKNGETTNIFIYEVLDEYVIGVNGTGWNFYDGVWDRLYDVLGLKWHKEE